jgi:hypothetical protein
MAFWIFKCDPTRYRLDDRLADSNPVITWGVSHHEDEIKPGDVVFLWVTGENKGIRAVLRVDELPRMMRELPHEVPYCIDIDTGERVRVVCTLIRRDVNLPATTLRNNPGLGKLSALRGYPNVTNYPVSDAEGAILMQLI